MKLQHRMRTGLVVSLLAAVALAGCGSDSKRDAKGRVEQGAEKLTVRLGYFPNITHAPGLVGVEKGIFADKLGPNVTLAPQAFNAGPAAVEAIFSGAIDATYIGPNPAINAFAKSHGEAIRIISGATSGGAYLVVNPSITSPAGLKGKKVATPQLGNTQDVALRSWLKANKLSSDPQGGGEVQIVPQDNGQALEAFKAGTIAGAWVPEPWATRMIQEGKGKVLVDEKTLWPGGQYVTTHLIVRTAFMKDHPDVVKHLLEGHVAAVDFVNANPAEAKTLVNQALQKLTGKTIAQGVIDAAWPNMTFTDDPIASSLRKGADDAKAVGLLDAATKLDGIYDLKLLNEVLRAAGKPEVKS
ncbi:MAG TPA: ABC transporter substrate-binding protein [Acidimicrobiia bacterium]|jgi:NitT/TauT family transport system substrate-binding protein|nr:ABC transporter substrate-binding protein [Acidimicrobiia bacterium]